MLGDGFGISSGGVGQDGLRIQDAGDDIGVGSGRLQL